jgi:succinate dehydrogenase/fumarate reductase flavoprotein subunit
LAIILDAFARSHRPAAVLCHHDSRHQTAGGPKTTNGRRDWNDNPIEGLYVAGNTMAQVTGMGYGGAGGTLGPGMTFGFIAGRHAAQQGAG